MPDDNDKHWPEAERAFDHTAREPDPPPSTSAFLPPHHPARRSAEAQQRRPKLDESVRRIDEIARGAELAKAVETPTAPSSRASVEELAAERHYHTLDLISAQTIEKISRLRTQLNKLESVVVADGNRLKTEIAAHVELARSANDQAEVLEKAIGSMQEYQTRLRKE